VNAIDGHSNHKVRVWCVYEHRAVDKVHVAKPQREGWTHEGVIDLGPVASKGWKRGWWAEFGRRKRKIVFLL